MQTTSKTTDDTAGRGERAKQQEERKRLKSSNVFLCQASFTHYSTCTLYHSDRKDIPEKTFPFFLAWSLGFWLRCVAESGYAESGREGESDIEM